MNRVIACERIGGSWRVEVEPPGGGRVVMTLEGSRAQALEQASWSRAEVEPA